MSNNIVFSVEGTAGATGQVVTTTERAEFDLIASGAGSVKIEVLMGNGTWQSSTDTTFTTPINKLVQLPAGCLRLSVVTATAGDVRAECRS